MAKIAASPKRMFRPESKPASAAADADFSFRLYAARLAARLWCSLLLLGMFHQWLEPLRIMGSPEGKIYYGLLLVLTAGLLAAGSIGFPSGMTAVLALAALCQSMVYLFGDGRGWLWLLDFGPALVKDISAWAQTGSMDGISQASRVLVLLTGWILLILSVQLLALNRHTVLLFLSISTVYLYAFELTSEIDMFWAIVRAFGFGLLLQFSVVFFRHSAAGTPAGIGLELLTGNEAGRSVRRGVWKPGIILGLAALLILSGVTASAAAALLLPVKPSEAFSLRQAFSSLEAWADSHRTDGIPAAVTGYEGSDKELGRPLELRKEVYFTAVSPVRTYWRGQTLSYYDGRGWSDPEDAAAAGQEAASAQEEEKEQAPAGSIVQKITFAEPQHGTVPLFSGGVLRQVEKVEFQPAPTDEPEPPAYTLLKDQSTEAAYIKMALSGSGIYGYQIESEVTPDAVREQAQTEPQAGLAASPDPSEVRYLDLQLPADLPDSVRELARSITAGTSSRYAAAEAVENYLLANYSYSLESTVPAEGHDFVEDFLFRQRTGYCDHFSTAMVVLLRSQGIPARWVKGFAPGEPSGSDQYTVRYSDAHAWVEVYFPKDGWVPFDPTPGFGGAASLETSKAAGSLQNGNEQAGQLDGMLLGLPWDQTIRQAVSIFTAGIVKLAQLDRQLPKGAAAAGATATLLLGLTIAAVWMAGARRARYRNHEQNHEQTGKPASLQGAVSAHGKHFPGKPELLRAADKAWAGLHRRHGRLAEGATVREYAEALSLKLDAEGRAEMETFLTVWEPLYYGGKLPDRQTTKSFLSTCRKWATL
ncbi:transglutaminase-like domain-containing protein [Paenibacillus pinistramenti]|uniref:transglutaminase-like domain-containing protein n=1 Tax=Paenibacillus pinistramenti TaxID=1768003 RepID=UPI0011082FED|nr:transglutaminase-like domain-containing protein [Paenibacillus pinistramenti]